MNVPSDGKNQNYKQMKNIERKIIFVPHCLMAKRFAFQNRSDTEEVLKVLFDFKTGIVQMPCPHLNFIMNKEWEGKAGQPFISEIMNKTPESFYDDIINPLLTQIENYRQLNFEIAGIIGVKGSPVCGIYDQGTKDYGSFINLLNKKLMTRGINLPIGLI